jgi:hypothetical protein
MIDLPEEIYERIEINGETYIVVQVLPGHLAICVRAIDVGGGADTVALCLMKIPE